MVSKSADWLKAYPRSRRSFMRYFVMSLPATSRRLVKCGREKPSYTGQMWVTPSPLSMTIPVKRPKRERKQSNREIRWFYLVR